MGSSRRWKRAKKSVRPQGGSGGGAVRDERDGVSMSDLLVDFAEPLLRGFTLPEDRMAFEAALKISSLLWNEGLLPRERRSKALYAELAGMLGAKEDPEVEPFFDSMIRRGRSRYPGVDRFIPGVRMEVDEEGNHRVDVSSTPSHEIPRMRSST